MAAAKDIPELIAPDRHVETYWEGMAHISTDFFTNILGARHNKPPP